MSVTDADQSQVFSAPEWRPVTMALNLTVLVVIAVLATRRTPDSWARWRAISATNLAVCLTLCDSLVYVALSTFVSVGLGTSRSIGVCSLVYFLCSFFYCAAKLTTAWFLIERARVVTDPLAPRRHNRLYLFNIALSSVWFAALVLILVVRVSRIRADGECLVTMGRGPAVGVIAIDAFLNIYYTSLFAVPLFRGKWQNPKLRQLATRAALAAVMTVASSVTNLGIMVAHGGTELSWVCLSTCTLDTVWCAIVLCALTSKRDDADAAEAALGPAGATATFGLSLNAPVWRAATLARADDDKAAFQLPALAPLGSPPDLYVAPLPSWGTSGRLGEDEDDGAGEVGGRTGERRLSVAPEEMCLGAVNERKCVDGAWKAPRPKQEGDEDAQQGKRRKVGFAEMLEQRGGR